MIKKRYIFGIFLILTMVISMAYAVDDVSAAKYKKFDQGKKYIGDGVTASWDAYSNGKTVKTTCNFYIKDPKTNKNTKYGSMKTTLTKSSKNTLKAKITVNVLGSKNSKTTSEKTKLSAKSYYNKHIKKLYKKGF